MANKKEEETLAVDLSGLYPRIVNIEEEEEEQVNPNFPPAKYSGIPSKKILSVINDEIITLERMRVNSVVLTVINGYKVVFRKAQPLSELRFSLHFQLTKRSHETIFIGKSLFYVSFKKNNRELEMLYDLVKE